MTDKTVSYIDLESYLRDAKRVANAVLQLHYGRGDRPIAEEDEEHYCVMQILLKRLRDDTSKAVEIFDGADETGSP